MENMSFEELLEINCFSNDESAKREAAEILEKYYCCEIHCADMDRSVQFAHHGRGCIIIAAKICKDVAILQNVTIGTNMKFNKTTDEWENIGTPIIAENVVICDGAKILGPIVIGANSVIAAGAIITKNIPENSIAYGVNQYKAKDPAYDLVFSKRKSTPSGEEIMKENDKLIAEFNKFHNT